MARGKKAEVEAPAQSDTDVLVIQSVRVDKFNTVRKRILLTPAVCEQCGRDFVQENELSAYRDLPAEVQERLKGLVQAHKDVQHSAAELQAVTRGELKKNYLGAQRR